MTLTHDAVLASLRDLPPLPAAVLELIKSVNDPDSRTDHLAECIGRDQALAARTLRLANSPFYGMPRRVTSLNDAATLLGMRTLRSMALAAGFAGHLPAPHCAGFDHPAFWRHGLAGALAAGALAGALEMDEGQAFTAGLLHDIGQLALATGFPVPYAAALANAQRHGLPLREAERASLGIDHAAVGALIAEQWRFAPEVVEAIAGHHDGARNGATGLAALVLAADELAHELSQPDGGAATTWPACRQLGLDEPRCTQLLSTTRTRHEALCAALPT